MVKALFALAKYLTWWFIKPLVSCCCVANLTHMLQTSSFNQTHAGSSCFKQYFPFLLEGKNIHNHDTSIASSHYFLKSITSSRCVEDTPGYTLVHTLVHDKYSPARWVSRKLRQKKWNNSVLYLELLQVVLFTVRHAIHLPNLNVSGSGSATWLPICIEKLSHNRNRANRRAWLEWLLIHLHW